MDIFVLFISLFLLIKGRLSWVLFGIILLTTGYLGAGAGLSTFPIAHNVSDTGLILYLALCIYILIKSQGKLTSFSINHCLSIFFLFLIITIAVDILLNKTDLLSIIKTSRHWVFLTCFWMFYYIPQREVEKIINYLLFGTIVISSISLIEFIFEIEIIGIRQPMEVTSFGTEFKRGSIPSSFSYFFIILLFTDYFQYKRWIRNTLIILFAAVMILSMIRSLILAITAGLFIIIILTGKQKVRSTIQATIVVTVVFLIAFSNPFIKDRFISGLHEVNVIKYNRERRPIGNLSFRIYHIKERVDYVSHNLQYSIFGVGNIIEEDFPQIFTTGLRNKKGTHIQLDTGDNAWAILFIRLGFVGTFIYLLLFLKILLDTIHMHSGSSLSITLFVYLLINLAILSFASSSIATGQFWLFPAIIFTFISKDID